MSKGIGPEGAATESRVDALKQLLEQRIVVLDGAMGTQIQGLKLDEAACRGERFRDWRQDVKGNNDLLTLTQPEAVLGIHRGYLEAGADIIETNTFTSNAPSQADYGMEALVYELNFEAARLARQAVDEYARETGTPRFVAGALGPTNRTASLSPDVNDPGKRNTTFDLLAATYADATRGLIAGGADLLLIETIFDTLNAKAATFAVRSVLDELGIELPVMISGTITDASGRTLSGQTTEAFWNSIRHAQPLIVGLNCALGPAELRPYIEELSRISDAYVSAYPNAGLPNAMGEYDEGPHEMACQLGPWAKEGLLNIVGGCCGSTPEHIAEIREHVSKYPPRKLPNIERKMRLSGLEPFVHA